MNKLQLPQAKLLYAVSELYRKRRIDETEKRMLKEKVITDNVEIFELLEQNENESQLFDKLIKLVSTKQEEELPVPPKNAEVAQAISNVEQEEATSPWGEFLRYQKIKHEYTHKHETNAIRELINPKKAD